RVHRHLPPFPTRRSSDLGQREATLDEQRDRPRRHRLRGEVVAVDAGAGHAAEEGAGADLARVVHDVDHLDALAAVQERREGFVGEAGEEVGELHPHPVGSVPPSPPDPPAGTVVEVAGAARTRPGWVVVGAPASAAAVSGAVSRATSGGAIRKSRRPYWSRSANTGAATEPP